MSAEAPSTYEALRFVAARYAAGVDQRDKALFLSAFTPDAVLTLPAVSGGTSRELHGHSEIATVIDLISRYPRTFHVIGQARYEFGSGGSAGEVYCVAHHITPGQDSDLVMYVRYLDTYRCGGAPDNWLIAKRLVNIDWTQTPPATASAQGQR